jgi:hypothetical protein
MMSSVDVGSSSSGLPCMTDIDTDPAHCGACFRPCSPQNTSAMPTCDMGICQPPCIPGWFDVTHPAAPFQDDGCETPAKRVFLRAQPTTGAFGGVAGADALCDATGTTVFGAGTQWKAWISDATSSVATRLTHNPAPYVLATSPGIQVAQSFNDFLMGMIQHPINETEMGMQLSSQVWTGTFATNGTPAPDNCANWTVGDDTAQGERGSSALANPSWTEQGFAVCQLPARLYCFEQ